MNQTMLTPRTYNLKEAFGREFPESMTAQGFEKVGHPFQVNPDPLWVWPRDVLLDLVIWWNEGGTKAAYSFGPTGSGKTSAYLNFSAALGIPFYERTVHADLDFGEIVIDIDLVDGTTVKNFGALPLAMGVDGAPGILCLNEVDRGQPGFVTGLYEVLEGRPVPVNNGGLDYIQGKPGFRIVGTGNTAMLGDHVGLHRGAETCDVAFMDRFWKYRHDYPSEEVERRILRQATPDVEERITNVLVDIAQDVRAISMYASDDPDAIPLTMSTRTLVSWSQLIWAYRGMKAAGQNPIFKALDVALLHATDGRPEWRRAILELVEGKLGTTAGTP